mgnify:CR=1 FL=1
MSFKVGETVVYPHHGAALIEAIEKRVIKGEEKTYLVSVSYTHLRAHET